SLVVSTEPSLRATSTLSLHDALPISLLRARAQAIKPQYGFNLHDQNIYYNVPGTKNPVSISLLAPAFNEPREINPVRENAMKIRSEEHTSELQSRENLVCRLLLEKKK